MSPPAQPLAPSQLKPRIPDARLAAAAACLASIALACAPGDTSRVPPAAPAAPLAAPAEPAAQAGLRLLRQGNMKEAEPRLLEALAAAPRDPRLLEALGTIRARTDRLRQAEADFRAAVALAPAVPGPRLGLAAVLIDTGRYDEARAVLADVERADPGNLTAALRGALLDARVGRGAAAEAAVRRVLAARPDDPEAHYILGLALLQRGAAAEAADEMKKTRERAPDHLGALSHLATLAMRLGRPADAAGWRRAHEEALRRLRVEERVRGRRVKAMEAFNRGDYRTALAELQVIAGEDPNDAQVHLHLGSTFIALGDLKAAEAELRRSLDRDPASERALAEMGRLQALSDRLDEAIGWLDRAVAANADFAEPHYYLAGIYRAKGDPARAGEEMRVYEELRRRSPDSAMAIQPGGGR